MLPICCVDTPHNRGHVALRGRGTCWANIINSKSSEEFHMSCRTFDPKPGGALNHARLQNYPGNLATAMQESIDTTVQRCEVRKVAQTITMVRGTH